MSLTNKHGTGTYVALVEAKVCSKFNANCRLEIRGKGDSISIMTIIHEKTKKDNA